MRPFGCHVTILNTIDHLGKFDGKADEGFFVGYSINSKAFRVFNSRTRIVEENLHVQFSENTPNIARSGPNWLFDIDALTKSMNYKPVIAGNQSNGNAGTKACDDAGKASNGDRDDEKKVTEEPGKEGGDPSKEDERDDQEKDASVNSTNNVNAASTNEVNDVGRKASIELPDDPNMPALEDIVYSDDDEDVGAEADMNNLDAFMPVSPIPTTRVHKDHPVEQIIRDLNSAPQTRRMTKNLEEHVCLIQFNKEQTIKTFKIACLLASYHNFEHVGFERFYSYILRYPAHIRTVSDHRIHHGAEGPNFSKIPISDYSWTLRSQSSTTFTNFRRCPKPPAEEHHCHVAAFTLLLITGYILSPILRRIRRRMTSEEHETPADYLLNRGDDRDDEEPSDDDDDDDDDAEEEEHLAPADPAAAQRRHRASPRKFLERLSCRTTPGPDTGRGEFGTGLPRQVGTYHARADLYDFANMLDAPAPGRQTSRELGYGITDTVGFSLEDEIIYSQLDDTLHDRALHRAQSNMLSIDKKAIP
ncbi:retrovirus-related pol polyprotein from transposon TNT 1-94 [Tanacetum coccineum]|uniref:Retrovirus-related pol polyprotein from transposon TNT 1-94 n=1 Tax=Tanacetum coccineum TaxID=301880 RepID=A0ABQ5ER44_9ASTR